MSESAYKGLPHRRYETGLQHHFKNIVFMAVLSETGDREKAETYASLWFNINFLGSEYADVIHQQVQKYTPAEYQGYLNVRNE